MIEINPTQIAHLLAAVHLMKSSIEPGRFNYNTFHALPIFGDHCAPSSSELDELCELLVALDNQYHRGCGDHTPPAAQLSQEAADALAALWDSVGAPSAPFKSTETSSN